MSHSQLEHLNLDPWPWKWRRRGQIVNKRDHPPAVVCGLRSPEHLSHRFRITLLLSACRGRKSDGVSTVTQPSPSKLKETSSASLQETLLLSGLCLYKAVLETLILLFRLTWPDGSHLLSSCCEEAECYSQLLLCLPRSSRPWKQRLRWSDLPN